MKMGFKDAMRHKRQRPQTTRYFSIMAQVANISRENLQVDIAIQPELAKRLGIPDDAPKTVPLEIAGDAKYSKNRPKIEDLLGVPGGNISNGMPVEAGSVMKCDQARYEDGKIIATWVRLIAGAEANRKAEAAGSQKHPILLEGMMKTFPIGEAKDRYRTDVLMPDAAQQVSSAEEAVNVIADCLTADGPGAAEAVVRMSNEQGQTLHRRASCYLKEDKTRETPREAIDRFMQEHGDMLNDAFASEGDKPATVEVIPTRSIAVGSQSSRDIHERVQATTREPTLRGSAKYYLTEIHPNRRLSGSYDDEGPPSDGLMAAMSRLAAERNRKIPEAATSDVNAARSFMDKNGKSFGYAQGTIAIRRGVNSETGEQYEFGIGLVADTYTGLPLAAIATPGAPNAPDSARNRAADLAETRDALLSGATLQADAPEDSSSDQDASYDGLAGEPEEEGHDEHAPGF